MSLWMLRVGNINQDVKCAVRSIHIAAMIFEQAHREVAAAAIGMAHLAHAILRTGQGSSSRALDGCADVGIAGIQHIGDGFQEFSACYYVADAPAGHSVAFREGINAGHPSLVELMRRQQRGRADVPTLEYDFVVALV